MNSKYMVRLQGSLYAFELYNDLGSYVYELEEAKEEALRQYGSEVVEVYNGSNGHYFEEKII